MEFHIKFCADIWGKNCSVKASSVTFRYSWKKQGSGMDLISSSLFFDSETGKIMND